MRLSSVSLTLRFLLAAVRARNHNRLSGESGVPAVYEVWSKGVPLTSQPARAAWPVLQPHV